MENLFINNEFLKEKIQSNTFLKILVYASLLIIALYCMQGSFAVWNFIRLFLKLLGLLVK